MVLIGILYQDSVADGRDYTAHMGNTLAYRRGRGWPRGAFVPSFGIPETFFVDSDGIIAGCHIGPLDEQTLIRGIDKLRPIR